MIVTPLTAQQTLDRAKVALQSGAAAGLPELLQLLESLSTDYLKVNLDELSILIEKDAAVLAKVITVANTLAHNPGIAPVATITQAIHLIGFQRIRSLTVSMMLLENTAGSRNPPEQRDAATEALCAGLFAQSCAAQLGTVEPDVAFSAATLRHFGYILFPAISIEHTREVTERLKTKPHDIAYRGMFGLTPIELTRRILASARLPEEVTQTLRDFDPEKLSGIASKFETRLTAISELGSRLAKHALGPSSADETFLGQARMTARKFERLIPNACDMVEPALMKTDENIQSFMSSTGVTMPTKNLGRISMHVNHILAPADAAPPTDGSQPATSATPAAPTKVPHTPDAETVPAAPGVEVAPSTTPTVEVVVPTPPAPLPPAVLPPPTRVEIIPPAPAKTTSTTKPWDEDLKKSSAFAAAPIAPAEPPLSAALALARDGLQADVCWLFQKLEGGTSLSLVGGTGPHWVAVQPSAALRAEDRNVFGVSLSRREVVVLHDTHDPAILRYLPDWWKSAENMPRAFALVPIQVGPNVIGLALAGWNLPRHVNVSAFQVGLAQQICAHAIVHAPKLQAA